MRTNSISASALQIGIALKAAEDAIAMAVTLNRNALHYVFFLN